MVRLPLSPSERLSRHKWLNFTIVNKDGEVFDPLGQRVDELTELEIQTTVCRYFDETYGYRPSWCGVRYE